MDSIELVEGTVRFIVSFFEKNSELPSSFILIEFDEYVSFRIVDESSAFNYFMDDHIEEKDVFIFEKSTYMSELSEISDEFAVTSCLGKPKHYGIFYLCNDCIEVISYGEPKVSYKDVDSIKKSLYSKL